MNLMLRHALCLSTALSLLLSTPAAHAEPPSVEELSEAQQRELASLIDLAEANVKRDENEKALVYFEEAYALFPHPQLLYRTAELHALLEQNEAAIADYKTFLKEMPDAPEAPAARRRSLELEEKVRQQRIAAERAGTSLRVLSSPPGARVFLNDTASRIKGSTPTVELPIAQPGTYTIIVQMEGYLELRDEVEIKAGDQVSKNYTLKRDPNAPVLKSGAAKRRGPRPGPLIMLGVGTVGLAGAATFGVLRSQDTELTREEFKRYDTLMYVSGGVALVGFGGALALWLAGRRGASAELMGPQARPARAHIFPIFSPTGERGVGVEMRF